MRMYDLIQKKRDGGELADGEIAYIVREYTAGNLPDYQIAALLMAIFYRGMSEREMRTLTMEMANSGDTVDLSEFGTLSVDKHSTGGVGDKTTLILAPIVAACGGKVAKMSGRGLGHTGGTVDKLESIPGYRTALDREAFMEQVRRVGVCVIGQSENLTPADKKLYALRDVTATVDSAPLIVSSVMSKKIAAGSHSIVLDVKVGSGAFLKTLEEGKRVAEGMVAIGKLCGRNMAALITNMDRPLGRAVGNALEIREAIDVLCGRERGDLRDICVHLATRMVSLCRGLTEKEAHQEVIDALDGGRAWETFKAWIEAQGGDVSVVEDTTRLPLSPYERTILADRDGYLAHMDAERIGTSALVLGAGRARKEDSIDHGAGLYLLATTGDAVRRGQPIARMYTSDESRFEEAARLFEGAIRYEDDAPTALPLIFDVIVG